MDGMGIGSGVVHGKIIGSAQIRVMHCRSWYPEARSTEDLQIGTTP